MKVYEYSDYRIFVQDKVEEIRKLEGGSIRKKLRKSGITDPSFLLKITKYRVNMGLVSAKKLAKFLGLDQNETRFLLKLVEFNQETRPSEKRGLAKLLMKNKVARKISPITFDKYDYFAKWYNIAIFELAGSKSLKNRPAEISKKLRGLVTPDEVSETIELLLRLNLITISNAKIFQSQKFVLAQDEISHTFIADHYDAFLKIGLRSLEDDQFDEREFMSVTFSYQKNKFKNLKGLLTEFRDEFVDVIADGEPGEDVFHLVLQLYPVTK